ncbi:hypothetical protein WDW86_05420 [Bdellovibrionota bacterium FG-2]
MNNDEKRSGGIETIQDSTLFEEVASRLRKVYHRQHGMEFLYGCFEFVFHEGRFQGIEDRPRYKRYKSPARLTTVPT